MAASRSHERKTVYFYFLLAGEDMPSDWEVNSESASKRVSEYRFDAFVSPFADGWTSMATFLGSETIIGV